MPDEVRALIGRRQEEVKQRLSACGSHSCFGWTKLSSVHLTLRFLGETTDRQRAMIAEGLGDIARRRPPLTLVIEGVGAFPNVRRPRVLWLGLHGEDGSLQQLQADVERLAQSCGFEAETRRYSPHLTIARAKRDASVQHVQRAGEAIAELSELGPTEADEGAFLADTIVHMRSELHPDGSVYTRLSAQRLVG